MGTAASGMQGHVRGWDVGAAVDMYAEGAHDDRAVIYATGGSSANVARECFGSLRNVDGTLVLTPSAWLIEQVANHAKEQKRVSAYTRRARRKLETSTEEVVGYRGHKLGNWDVYKPSDGTEGKTSSNACGTCGMSVHVDVSPGPNGIDISGPAVALDCPKTRQDRLTYCEAQYMDGVPDEQTGDVNGPVGHVYRVHRYIVVTDEQGFKDLTEHYSEDDAKRSFAEYEDKLAKLDREIKCPRCSEPVWDMPHGHKLAKCWGCGLAFDTMDDDETEA